jgi:hypothetical protein
MATPKRFLLRLDPRLFDAIRRWADEDLRSINAQIEYLLTDQARRAGRLPHRRRKPPLADISPSEEDEGRDPSDVGVGTAAGSGRGDAARR